MRLSGGFLVPVRSRSLNDDKYARQVFLVLLPPLPGPQNAANGRRLGSLSGRFRNAPPRQFSLFQSFGGRGGDLTESSAENKILMLQRHGDFAAGKCVRLGILLAGWKTPYPAYARKRVRHR